MPQAAPPINQAALDLESLAADVVALAMKAGASDAEAVVREGDEFSVNVRMGEVETLKESGSRGLGLRVFLGTRSASTSTSDLTPDGIRQLVEGAMALAKVTEEDPFAGLPETADFGSVSDDLHLYYDDVYSLSGPERIEWARRAEAAALAADPRITNSDGGSFDAATGRKVLANSRGFLGGYRTSYAGVSAAPLAMDANGQMQRDGWWSGARRMADLDSPEAVGSEAARRGLSGSAGILRYGGTAGWPRRRMDGRGTALVSRVWMEGGVVGQHHLAGRDGGDCGCGVGSGWAAVSSSSYREAGEEDVFYRAETETTGG